MSDHSQPSARRSASCRSSVPNRKRMVSIRSRSDATSLGFGRGARDLQLVDPRRFVEPAVAAPGMLPTHLECQLVPGHADQEPDELVGALDLELARRRPGEEADQHRLGDVHRVEDAEQGAIAEPQPDLAADHALESLDQFASGVLVPLADPR